MKTFCSRSIVKIFWKCVFVRTSFFFPYAAYNDCPLSEEFFSAFVCKTYWFLLHRITSFFSLINFSLILNNTHIISVFLDVKWLRYSEPTCTALDFVPVSFDLHFWWSDASRAQSEDERVQCLESYLWIYVSLSCSNKLQTQSLIIMKRTARTTNAVIIGTNNNRRRITTTTTTTTLTIIRLDE